MSKFEPSSCYSVFFVSLVKGLFFLARMPKTNRKKNKSRKPYEHEKNSNTPTESDNQDIESSEDFICIECKKSVDEVVQCERCARWFCCTCQNISEKMYDAIVEFSKLHWFCNGCESDAAAVFQLPAETAATKVTSSDDILLAVTNTITTAMESLQGALTKTLGNVLSANTHQDSAQNTRMDFDTATDPEVHVDVQNVEVFQVVDEYVEREKRKNNLIIHNLP